VAAQPPQDEAQRVHAFFDHSDKGFFAEVGIRAGSPTWPLERAGWTGVLVEPSPDIAAFLVTARAAQVFATACVAPDVAGRPLSLRVASPLASVNVGQPAGTTPSSYVVTVPTRTLDDMQEAEAPTPVDLVVLDVYGHELEALLWHAAGSIQQWYNAWLVQHAHPCTPCQKEGCERHLGSASACLDELSAAQVLAAADQALADAAPTSETRLRYSA
jgi:FkbM family methyltransferase